MDVNTEPSQNEQIVWDDPTARQERAKLADNLQWPGSPSQRCEAAVAPPPAAAEDGSNFRDSMTDSELVEMGRTLNATQNCLMETNPYRSVCKCLSLIITLCNSALCWAAVVCKNKQLTFTEMAAICLSSRLRRYQSAHGYESGDTPCKQATGRHPHS